MRFFTTPDSPMHSISMYFPTMIRRGLRPRRGRRPKAAALIVGKYIEIECLGGGSGGVKNRILCLQKQMGNRKGPHVLA